MADKCQNITQKYFLNNITLINLYAFSFIVLIAFLFEIL